MEAFPGTDSGSGSRQIAAGATTPRQRSTAAGLVLGFAVLTVFAIALGRIAGPHLTFFIPMFGTLCVCAAAFTAFFLFSQFRVTGFVPFLGLGAIYEFSAFLTLAWLMAYPGTLSNDASLRQLAGWLWTVWHLVFAASIFAYSLFDPSLSRRVAKAPALVALLRRTIAYVALAACACIALIVAPSAHLPALVAGKLLTPLFTDVIAPLVAIVSLAAAARLWLKTRAEYQLQLWVVLALCIAGMEGLLLPFAAGRESLGWYIGKAETLAMASIVLIGVLSNLTVLYDRIYDSANVDPLTGLANRRAFTARCTWVEQHAARRTSAASILMIDIDGFKQYNDHYGHASGDLCLTRVAEALRAAVPREADCVARFGGEEFVVLLAETPFGSAGTVADRILAAIRTLAIPHAGLAAPGALLSVSIGLTGTDALANVGIPELLRIADEALYAAKAAGRDRAVLLEYPSPGERAAWLSAGDLARSAAAASKNA